MLRKITEFRLVSRLPFSAEYSGWRNKSSNFDSRIYSMSTQESAAESSTQILPSGLRDVLKTPKGLEVKIFYLECLAQASYLISHQQSAFVIDPRRDVDAYILEAQNGGMSIKGILETHVHADFVSGHFELSKRTGGAIYFGPGSSSRLKFPHYEVEDNELLDFTDTYSIQALHTPGHTMESVVWMVIDKSEGNRPLHAFTGDTLFIGSCGRPDLVGAVGHSAEEMSERMYHSLKNKICTLPDDVKVFPAHGAGSPCGKNLSSDLYSTIGQEKATNPALQYNDVSKFVEYLTEGQPTAPSYFSHDVQTNMEGAAPLADEASTVPRVSAKEIKEKIGIKSIFIVDTRSAPEYAAGHVAGTLNIPLGAEGGVNLSVEDGNFSIWVGTVIPKDSVIYLINEQGRDLEAIQRLGRIGYKVSGILNGGIEAWKSELNSYERLKLNSDKQSLNQLLSSGYKLLDVRTAVEHANNSAKVAMNVPLANIEEYIDKLDKNTQYICHCASGFRSTIAASFLNRLGFKVQDIYGGFAAISVFNPELTTSGAVCPTMKKMIDKLQS